MTALATFLRRNTISEASPLPLVHTTRSYNISDIKNKNTITKSPCRHFDGQDLVYLFVGRPAYRRKNTESEAAYWELPCCFIFDSIDQSSVERTFPFDSGAFKDNLYPSYINFMNINEFEASSPVAPSRIISAFYGSSEKYFSGQNKGPEAINDEFQLGPLDAEIKALARLASDGTPKDFDDRRFTIEVQLNQNIDLNVTPPSAVVIPSIYLRDEDIRNKITKTWGADAITYEIYGLSQDKYDGIIYSKVAEYYKSRNLV